MKSTVYLSYPLTESTPLYGNGKGILLESDQNQGKGDSCNTMKWSFPNHSGTHIDAPKHFDVNGKDISDYPAEFWIFKRIELVDISESLEDCQLIEPDIFPDFCAESLELILIKTGYEKFRGRDRYTLSPPGISAKVAPWIRQKYPTVRCIGMDLISVSSFANRSQGREAHKAFLADGNPILLLEDMTFNELPDRFIFDEIIISPLIASTADGSPCTVFARINHF